MSCTLVLVEQAEQQLRGIDEWWRANHGGPPDLFLDELERAMRLLRFSSLWSSMAKAALTTAAFRLSGTTVSGTPPSSAKASTCS
jgi:hypothetical protein